jgi:C1A family cysteine protease
MLTLDATDWALYAGGVLDCDAPGKGVNHAVVVVGYLNKVLQPNGEKWDMFIIRNSFGSWWGAGNGPYAGHIFIRKGCSLMQSVGPSALHGLEGVMPLFG